MDNVDFIIVGAGAAGCVLANRLVSLGGARVALIEAGGRDDAPTIHATDIGSMTSMWGPCDQNWAFQTVPQAGMGGRRVDIAQGRGLGGGTSINAMMYVRGNPKDFDRWAQMGARGWAYKDVLPYFMRGESYDGGDDAYRGRSGGLRVIDMDKKSAAAAAFMAATRDLGHSRAEGDFNGAQHEENAFLYQSTRLTTSERCSTATAFLDPLRNDPRLILVTDAQVSRIVIEGGRAVGVEYVTGGRREEIRASREVILTAGAFLSPQLLMLSGIGPADHLRAHGINVVSDLPGVGQNLHDHLLLPVCYRASLVLDAPQLLSEAGIFLYTGVSDRSTSSPDLQFFFGPIQFADPQYVDGGPGFTLVPILAQPRSRGTVRLASADPMQKPVVDPAYLTDPRDVEVLLRGLRIARDLAADKAFDGMRDKELAPGSDATSEESLVAYIRASASTVWHPVGTCRMGDPTDATTVLDSALRVRGVSGLRVADASAMPMITSGNTNAAAIMIGDKAAVHILA
ncbi:GMC family oxidoreductase [Roseicyclus mahoneyensis]|uniref:Choline dehydrogenase n=1 Tax=Roseicyclus mahoneyensis TaxID=164332 RepID=A0A316GGZ5_9RHOB|nr:GMC family oxidoreductase N-terminal domain-containing protein [Roseicyclus mahoneyensis]PWK59216.1 choline dehydrogenase [Roseicyclus mahoneyensis]